MIGLPRYWCQVCGLQRHPADLWLLLVPDADQQFLRVQLWDNAVAQRPGVYHLCSAAHARQVICEFGLSGRLPLKRIAEPFDIQEMPHSDEYPWMLRHDESQLEQLANAIEDLLHEEYTLAKDKGRNIVFDA